MTKKDMAISIAAKSGIPPVRVTEIVPQVFDSVIETLVQEGRLELRGFGVFEVKRRQPRQARNPRTGGGQYRCLKDWRLGSGRARNCKNGLTQYRVLPGLSEVGQS